jgi:hypothetical protein
MQTTRPHNADFWLRIARSACDLDTLKRELSELTDAEIEAQWLAVPAHHLALAVDDLLEEIDRGEAAYARRLELAA